MDSPGRKPWVHGRKKILSPTGATLVFKFLVPPLQGSGLFSMPNPGLTPWATICRPFRPPYVWFDDKQKIQYYQFDVIFQGKNSIKIRACDQLSKLKNTKPEPYRGDSLKYIKILLNIFYISDYENCPCRALILWFK